MFGVYDKQGLVALFAANAFADWFADRFSYTVAEVDPDSQEIVRFLETRGTL